MYVVVSSAERVAHLSLVVFNMCIGVCCAKQGACSPRPCVVTCDDGHLRFQCECDDGLAGFGMILIGLWFMYCALCTVSSRSGVPGKEGGSKRKLVVGCLDGSWVGRAPNLHSTSTYF